MNLEFGCGENPTKEGFKTCDIRNLPGVDYACPAWKITEHVEPNTVDEIWSRHFFEHLTFAQGKVVLDQWYNILKPGGIMGMMLPNLDFHLRQLNTWNDMNAKGKQDCRAGLWGWQHGDFEDTWDTHKSGYNKNMLFELLSQHGFVNLVSKRNPKNRHLEISCNKP